MRFRPYTTLPIRLIAGVLVLFWIPIKRISIGLWRLVTMIWAVWLYSWDATKESPRARGRYERETPFDPHEEKNRLRDLAAAMGCHFYDPDTGQLCSPPANRPSAAPAAEVSDPYERRTVPLAEMGPRWLTAPPGFKPIGGPLEVTYLWDPKREEWVAEVEGHPGMGQGTTYGHGKTQPEAHDYLVLSIMEASGGTGGTLFERRERRTAGGVEACCGPMRVLRSSGVELDLPLGLPAFRACPWCRTPLA